MHSDYTNVMDSVSIFTNINYIIYHGFIKYFLCVYRHFWLYNSNPTLYYSNKIFPLYIEKKKPNAHP